MSIRLAEDAVPDMRVYDVLVWSPRKGLEKICWIDTLDKPSLERVIRAAQHAMMNTHSEFHLLSVNEKEGE